MEDKLAIKWREDANLAIPAKPKLVPIIHEKGASLDSAEIQFWEGESVLFVEALHTELVKKSGR
jgi:hypothetical protein